jgi:hypothetical protein
MAVLASWAWDCTLYIAAYLFWVCAAAHTLGELAALQQLRAWVSVCFVTAQAVWTPFELSECLHASGFLQMSACRHLLHYLCAAIVRAPSLCLHSMMMHLLYIQVRCLPGSNDSSAGVCIHTLPARTAPVCWPLQSAGCYCILLPLVAVAC